MKRRRWWLLAAAIGFAIAYFAHREMRAIFTSIRFAVMGRATIEDRVAEYGSAARARLRPQFDDADIGYPPAAVVLAAFKREKMLQLFAANEPGDLRFIRAYPILAVSGELGPKLSEGDRQVPEGLYRIESLNPNSRFHMSLRLDYPNRFDRARAQEENRRQLGGDIMIHGSDVSLGCIALGDQGIEELFVLVADAKKERVSVILSPVDFRVETLPGSHEQKNPWLPLLYEEIRSALSALPSPPDQ